MKYMLDTNVLINLIRNNSEFVRDKFRKTSPDEICISSITYAELEYGVEKSVQKAKNRVALMKIVMPIKILPYEDRSGVDYGIIRASLEKQGNTIGPNDLLIASHARSLGLTLVTNNTKEFCRVEGLHVENWTDSTKK